MIIFRSVSFTNFLSYGNVPTEVKLDQNPTTLLIGESGSGKSTITDAISFALFGRPFRPINKGLITNTINNKNCLVELLFNVGVVEYKIRRGIKPATFEIYQNGKLLNQESHVRDYQDYLEKNILGMSFHSFSQIVILGTANFTPFMQMKAADRRALIEDLLDIQIFSVMVSLLKEKIYETKIKIDEYDNQISLTTEKAKLQAKYIIQIEKNTNEQIDVHKKTIDETLKQVTIHEQNICGCNSRITELQQLILDEKDIVDKISNLSDQKRRFEDNIKRLNKELSIYEATKECPTCRREFDSNFKEQVVSTCKSNIGSFKDSLTETKDAAIKIQERYEEIRKVKNQIQVIERQKLLEEANISSSNSLIPRIQKAINELQNTKGDSSKEREILKQLKLRIKEIEVEKNNQCEYFQTLEIASKILKDGGVKAQIIKQYLPIINRLVNRFLAAMHFNVMFYIDENFEEIIKRRGRDVLTYYSLSEGERQRLDIAILLTWRTIATMKNSIHTNLLFIDELLDSSLDQSATENIIELMSSEQILKQSNIFVISHKNNIVDKFSNFLKFEMYKNFSRIVQND